MNVKSGTVAKVYSITLSPMAIFRRLIARSKLSRIRMMETKDTRAERDRNVDAEIDENDDRDDGQGTDFKRSHVLSFASSGKRVWSKP
jgi:hypothetical protein